MLLADYKQLKGQIKEQKDENELLYKSLLHLKKETASAAQKIILCQNRIARMENNIGLNTASRQGNRSGNNAGNLESALDQFHNNDS